MSKNEQFQKVFFEDLEKQTKRIINEVMGDNRPTEFMKINYTEEFPEKNIYDAINGYISEYSSILSRLDTENSSYMIQSLNKARYDYALVLAATIFILTQKMVEDKFSENKSETNRGDEEDFETEDSEEYDQDE